MAITPGDWPLVPGAKAFARIPEAAISNTLFAAGSARGSVVATLSASLIGATIDRIEEPKGKITLSPDTTKLIANVPLTEEAIELVVFTSHPRAKNSPRATKLTLTGVPPVRIDNASIDEGTAAGTAIGRLSMPNAVGFAFSLVSNAGGMFGLSGDQLTVGNVALSHDTAPSPSVIIRATRDGASLDTQITLNVRRPLPALPLATGARVVAHGDSHIGYNNYGGAQEIDTIKANKAVSSYAYGFAEQASSIDPRFNFASWYDPADPSGRCIAGANQGVHGDHLRWDLFAGGILGRLPAVLARRPDLLIFEGGTNSINSGDDGSNLPATPEYCIAQLDRCLALCRNEGVPVILMTMYQIGLWPAGDVRHAIMAAVNNWIRAQAGRDGVLAVLDATDILSPGGVIDPSLYLPDATHLGHRGALRVGRDKLLPILQGAISAGSVFDQDPTISNLWPASVAKLQGTNGSLGANCTGQVAAGSSVAIIRNASTVACSKQVVSGDVEAQIIDITPADLQASVAWGGASLQLPIVGSGLPAVGSWVQSAIFVEADASEVLSSVRGTLAALQGSTARATTLAMAGFSSDYATPLIGNRGWWVRSKPMRIPPDTTYDRLRLIVEMFFRKAGAPTRVKLSKPILRTIADPRIAWRYPTD